MNEYANNKRIAKNTLMLYFRMLLIMGVTLYTSRIILQQLGVVDYGIYNVIGGVVAMFSFLNNSMASATQRFLNFELGKKNKENLKKVFSTSLNIHILLGITIVCLAESLGLYFFYNKLVIPLDRQSIAFWVYQLSVCTFFINIIQVPYNAAIIAHEKMSAFAYISIVEVFLKLALVVSLSLTTFDKLLVYAILMFVVQLIVRLIYQTYCRKHFQECRFSLTWDKTLFKSMFSFAGWNVFGSMAWLLRGQGLNILLNMFFGPIVNAAQGIAAQVNSAISSFVSNFQVALNPQITKNYASNNIYEMETLAYRGIKFSMILILFFSLPIVLNINFILELWLGSVPEYASYFVILLIIDMFLANIFGNPFMASLAATGKIRNYQISVSTILLLILPISYVVLCYKSIPYLVFLVSILLSVLAGIVRYTFCVKQIGFSPKRFIKEVISPTFKAIGLSIPLPFYASSQLDEGWTRFFTTSLSSLIIIFIVAWFIVLQHTERLAIIDFFKTKLNKK